MNARFWVYWNEPTKVTLRPGQSIHLYRRLPTDEGWTAEELIVSFDGAQLLRHWMDSGRDCDGQLDRFGTDSCPLAEIRANYNDYAGVWYPSWQREDSGQHDQYAELAGY